MRLTVVLEGKRTPVDVSDDGTTVTVDGRSFPVRVVARTPVRVELEIAGEKSVVEEWPEPFAAPPTPVVVDGERWVVEVVLESTPSATRASAAPATAVTRSAPRAEAPDDGAGVAVVPPMPGRVVELKVHEGDHVRAGSVLLVLEAMKMRNEVTSPADGVVRNLRVSEGSSIRAREPMLRIAPA